MRKRPYFMQLEPLVKQNQLWNSFDIPGMKKYNIICGAKSNR
jgi:hypothetical protein